LLLTFALLLAGAISAVIGSLEDPIQGLKMERDYSYPAGEGVVKWVSTDWLEEHLNDKIMILDVQPNVHDYIMEHIPGAIYMNEGLLRVQSGRNPAAYVPPEAIEPSFQSMGLDPDVPVVVYTGTGAFTGLGNGLEQTHAAYCLARYGHSNVYVLDGGLDKWREDGRPLTKVFLEVESSRFQVVDRSDEYAIGMEELKEIKDNDDVVLLDARPARHYEGQGPWIKPGHIPGAVNLPWVSLMDDDNARLLKPDAEITSILEEHGITPDKTIICSCGTSREATAEFVLLKWYFGYPDVRIYEGSFTEWSAYPENPIVTGPNPY